MPPENECAPSRPGHEAQANNDNAKESSAIAGAAQNGSNVLPLVQLRSPPAELARLPAWLMWRYEGHAASKKPRKVPYYAPTNARRTGTQGSTTDRTQLVTFKDALKAAARYKADGVGMALLPDLGIVALDFDNCVDDQGVVRDDVANLVSSSYAELSPSGRGVRAFFKGRLASRKSFAHQGHAFDVEFFGDSGFVTYTGNVLPACELLGAADALEDLTPAVLALYRERGAGREFAGDVPTVAGDPLDTYEPRLGLSLDEMRRALAALDPDMPEPEWVRVGWAIAHETEKSDEGLALWHEWSSGALRRDGAGSGKYDELAADEKWRHFGHHQGRPVTFRSVLKMAKGAGGAPRTPAAFTFRPWSECDQAAPTEWLIKGVIPKAELGMVYGESGSGKTFLVLDLVGAIARGEAWRGRRVRRARVVYVAAEGAGGFRMRVKAYREHHGVGDADSMMILEVAPNLLHDPAALIAAIADLGAIDLVVFDTFARTTPGANENAAEDMGRALAHCKAIHEQTGATVLLVHHSGKDAARGARGWSGIRAACDFEIEVTRSSSGETRQDLRCAAVTKLKDGNDGERFWFRLRGVDLGRDADGDLVSSCVVLEADAPASPALAGAGKWQRHVLAAHDELAGVGDDGVARHALLARAAEREDKGKGRDRRRELAAAALAVLGEKRALVEHDDGLIYRAAALPATQKTP